MNGFPSCLANSSRSNPALVCACAERLGGCGVFAGVKPLLGCDSRDGGRWYKLMHQHVITNYPWRHYNHCPEDEHCNPLRRPSVRSTRALRAKEEVDQQDERK